MASTRFHLTTFGRLALTDDSGRDDPSLSTRPRKLALLAWLALRPGRCATRDRIIGVFWGDRDESRARNSLADAVSHLRRVLGRDAIPTRGCELVIPEDAPLVVDAIELSAAASRRDDARVTALYKGAFLDGFYINDSDEFDDWRDRERARFARLFAASAARRCEELAEICAWEECRALAERWLDVELASPQAGAMLLRAIAGPGTAQAHAEVLTAYQGLVRRLDRELGVAPDAEVMAVVVRAQNSRSFAALRMTNESAALRMTNESAALRMTNESAALRMTEEGSATPDEVRTAAHSGEARTALAPSIGRNSRARMGVSVALVLAIVAAGVAATRRARPLDPHRVIVTVLENRTGDSTLSQLGAIASDWISRGLTETRAVEVADRLLNTGAGKSADPRDIGRAARAGTVIVGSYERQGDSIAMDARIVDANTGRVLRSTAPAIASVSHPLTAVNLLRQRVAGAMAAEVDPILSGLASQSAQPPTYDAYLAWMEGLDLFSRTDYRAAIPVLLRAGSLDSSFVTPRIWALAAYGNMGDYAMVDSIAQTLMPVRGRMTRYDRALFDAWIFRLRGDNDGQYAAGRELLAAAPGAEPALFFAGSMALHDNRVDEAIDLLRRIPVESSPVLWDTFGTQLGLAYHMAGRYGDELRETSRRLARKPNFLDAMEEQGRALIANGRLRDASELMDRIVQSGRAPGQLPVAALFNLADEMMIHGHAEEARPVFARVVALAAAHSDEELRRGGSRLVLPAALYRIGDYAAADSIVRARQATAPDDISLMRLQGLIAARRRDAGEATAVIARLASLRHPYMRGSNTIARAEIAAGLGRNDEAVRLVKQAVGEGQRYTSLHARPELLVLRGNPAYEAFIAPVPYKNSER